MRNLKLEETGRRLTKYPCYLGFYDFTNVQGRMLGWLVKLTGLSQVTHVGPIITVPGVGDMTITICQARHGNKRYSSVAKIHTKDALNKLGVRLIHKAYVGDISMDLSETIVKAHNYTDVGPWDLIFHQFVGRFIGLTRPRACASYVCSLFDLEDTWHPATLYRRYR